MVCYSLSNICEIKAQIDHCPGEAQPLLVLRQERNYSQYCHKEDTTEYNMFLFGWWANNRCKSKPQKTMYSLMTSYQKWCRKGNAQRVLAFGSGIWLSIYLAWCRCKNSGRLEALRANLPQYPSLRGAVTWVIMLAHNGKSAHLCCQLNSYPFYVIAMKEHDI